MALGSAGLDRPGPPPVGHRSALAQVLPNRYIPAGAGSAIRYVTAIRLMDRQGRWPGKPVPDPSDGTVNRESSLENKSSEAYFQRPFSRFGTHPPAEMRTGCP